MKLFIAICILLIATPAWGAPVRTSTYVDGEVIEASDVTANEDAIFDYLQAGVDTYAASSINSAAILDGTVDISTDTNLTVGGGLTLTNDNITSDLGTSIDISGETNLTAGAGITLTNDTLSIGGTAGTITIDFLYANDTVSGVTVVATNTVTSIVVDTQYLEHTLGGAVTVRDDLTVNGIIRTTNPDSFAATLGFPDTLQAEIDQWGLKTIETNEFPSGVTVKKLWLKTSASLSYSLDVEIWSDPTTLSSQIGTVATSNSTEANTVVDVDVSAGSIIMLDLPTTDVGWIMIQVDYIKQ